MSSEEKPEDSQTNVEDDSPIASDEKLEKDSGGEVDDDRGEDQLVIDEPDEKSDGESDEKEFEPTLDMMMNDFDDEQTMEEEEANEDQENEEDELAALEQEQDMPIEELLKMYGAVPADPGPAVGSNSEEMDKTEAEKKSASSDQDGPSQEKEEPLSESGMGDADLEIGENGGEISSGKRRGSTTPPPSVKKSKSELARFYEAAVEGRALRSQGSGPADEVGEEEEEEEGEDSDNENRDYSWKKTIMIGPSYQASVPSDLDAYGDTLPYGTIFF